MSDTGKNIAEQIVCQLSRLNELAALTELTKTFAKQVTCSTRKNTDVNSTFLSQLGKPTANGRS